MVEADSRLITWLLHESGITRYKISKDIGISESTLSRIANGETPMEAVRFGYASKLTKYARSIQPSSDGKESRGDTEPTSTSESEGGEDE
jgi:transcriptional regulator with XRE-family HTH domain